MPVETYFNEQLKRHRQRDIPGNLRPQRRGIRPGIIPSGFASEIIPVVTLRVCISSGMCRIQFLKFGFH